MDEIFDELNKVDESEFPLGMKALALNGFIALEKINKLIPYDEVEKIDEEVKKYFGIVDAVLKEIKNS